MLRTLALVLLVANAVLLAAQFGVFDRLTGAGSGQPPQREPERLQRQVHPELIRVLAAPAATAALSAAAASAAQTAAAASSAAALSCLEAGPFGAADADAAERTLRDAGLAPGSWAVQKTEEAGAYLVYMGRYADRETLQRKLDEVKRMKIDAEDLRNAPALQPGLSLGRFASKADADAALARLVQRGVRTARVVTLKQAQSQTLLRVAAADAAARARLAGLRLPSGPGFVACAADAPPAAASEPASANASANPSPAASSAASTPAKAVAPATSAPAKGPTASAAPAPTSASR